MATVEFDCDAVPGMGSGVRCRIAATRSEREAAFELVYEAYLRSGLSDPNPWRVRVTPYHLLPDAEVFVAVHRGQVLLTYTFVFDGELGVPMELVYAREVDELRRAGVRFAEATCLADRREELGGAFLPVFLNLTRFATQFAAARDPPDRGGHAPAAFTILSPPSRVRTVRRGQGLSDRRLPPGRGHEPQLPPASLSSSRL